MFYFNAFRKIRKEKKIKATNIARDLGRTSKTMWMWEMGKSKPTESEIRLMAQLLNVSVGEISDLKELKFENGNAAAKKDIPELDIKDMAPEAAARLKALHESYVESCATNTRLRANLFKHETLLQNLPFMIYVKDKRLKYRYVNERFTNVIGRGYTKESLQGTLSSDIFGANDYSRISELEQKALYLKQKISNQQIFIPNTFKEKIGLLTIIPILNENEEVEEIIGSIEDITDTYEEQKRRKDLEAVVNKVSHMLWIGEMVNSNDESFKYSFISDNVSDIYGVEKQDMFKDNKLWMRIAHPDDFEIVDKWRSDNCQETNRFPKKIEYRINNPKRGTRWIYSEIFKEGENKFYGVVTDITEEKEKEREREAILSTLNAADDAIKIAKIKDDDKEYIYVNKANKNLYELAISEIKNNPDIEKEFIHPDDKNRIFSIAQKKQEGHSRLNYKLLFPDGKIKYVEEDVFREISDGVLYLGTIKRDVTEEKKAKEEQIRLLADTMNNIDSCILITTNTESDETVANDRFKMLFVSDGFEKIFSTAKNHILKDSRYLRHFIHKDDFKRVDKCWKTVCDKGLKKEISLTYRIIDANGTEKLISDYAKPIGIINGKPVRFGMLTDITNADKKMKF